MLAAEAEHVLEMPSAEDQDPVEAVGANRAYPELGTGIRVRRLDTRAARGLAATCVTAQPAGPFPSQMRIQVRDERLLADLLAFMRASGCIAYYDGDTEAIDVLRPHAFGEQEDAEIEELVKRWLAQHPQANAEIVT